jgi:hypothetical protein
MNSQSKQKQNPTAEQDESIDTFISEVFSADGQIASNWRNGKSWRAGMKIARDPHPDAEIEKALRLYEQACASDAGKTDEQKRHRGRTSEMLELIITLAESPILEGWNRDHILLLYTAINLVTEDNGERRTAIEALNGLADAFDKIPIDNIKTLRNIAEVAAKTYLKPTRGRPASISKAKKRLIERLMDFYTTMTGKPATVTSNTSTKAQLGEAPALSGEFMAFAVEVCSFLPGNIEPSQKEIRSAVEVINNRTNRAEKAETVAAEGKQ